MWLCSVQHVWQPSACLSVGVRLSLSPSSVIVTHFLYVHTWTMADATKYIYSQVDMDTETSDW